MGKGLEQRTGMKEEIKPLNVSQVAVLRERAIYPHKLPSPRFHDDPVKVMIQMERPVYDFLCAIAGETQITASVEDTIETLVRTLADDNGFSMDFLKRCLPENPPSIEWPDPEKIETKFNPDDEIPF